MPRQVTDEEYNFLQGRRQVADFVESIYNDPALTNEAKALIKKKYPNLAIPDHDIRTEVNQRLDKERQEREEERRIAKDKEDEANFKKARSAAQEKYALTEEGMGKLEQMMIERNIGNYDDAAYLMISREPKASDPTHGDNSRWQHEKGDGFAEIAKDPEAWGRDQIMRAIQKDQERTRSGR